MPESPALAPRDQKPFVPSDMPADRLLARAAFAHVCAAGGRYGQYPSEVVRALWPRDLAALHVVERSARVPATTTGSGWADVLAAQSTGAFLASLVPSAGAALIAAGARFDLTGMVKVNLPRASSTGSAKFIAEGDPIPVGQGTFTSVPLGPPAKLALIESLTRETAEHSAEDGETIIGIVLRDAARAALDAMLFSSTAASSNNPAGLLNGISATTATAGAAGYAAALSDARALVDACVSGGGGSDVRFFASPGRALVLQSYMAELAGKIYGSAAIPGTQLIALDVAAFASGFDAVPQLKADIESTIHMEDTNPQQIGVAGTPNVVAAPTRNMFQTDSIALKMVLRCAWAMRTPAVAHIDTGLAW